ncbi:MAG: HAD family hydrolase [Bacilli bacterium]
MPKILATDLDGTLFFPKRRLIMIPRKNLEFLREFYDAGNKIVVVSGRNVNFAKKVEKKIGRPITFIGCNFAYVYEEGIIKCEKTFDGQKLLVFLESLIDKFEPISFVGMSKDENCVIRMFKYKLIYKILYPIYNLLQCSYRESYKIENSNFYASVLKNNMYKCMVMFGVSKQKVAYTSIVNKYLNTYDKFCEISWSGKAIELTPTGASKSAGLSWYLKEHGYSEEDLYVVGDSGNDITMFKDFNKNSFCMEHGDPTVKKYAKHIIKNFNDIKEYILNEKGKED